MSYYILNGFLNFNIIFLAACVSLPAVVSISFFYEFVIYCIIVTLIPFIES